mgnify:CR=1 FL=1
MINRLKMYRQMVDYTQAQMAEKIKVSRQTIHAIESGKYVPSTELALRLSQELNCQVEDLFSLD